MDWSGILAICKITGSLYHVRDNQAISRIQKKHQNNTLYYYLFQFNPKGRHMLLNLTIFLTKNYIEYQRPNVVKFNIIFNKNNILYQKVKCC